MPLPRLAATHTLALALTSTLNLALSLSLISPSPSPSSHPHPRLICTLALGQVAAAIFASPPTGTYAEAKEHFATAETTEPGFYVKNRCHQATAAPPSAPQW